MAPELSPLVVADNEVGDVEAIVEEVVTNMLDGITAIVVVVALIVEAALLGVMLDYDSSHWERGMLRNIGKISFGTRTNKDILACITDAIHEFLLVHRQRHGLKITQSRVGLQNYIKRPSVLCIRT